MITMILFMTGYAVCKFLIFCSMLYILFSPSIMWLYLGIMLGHGLICSIYKTIQERKYNYDEITGNS